jgi:UDP-N-acetylmuramoyl-tripeptide--D-alanyl-D-alanine ligase
MDFKFLYDIYLKSKVVSTDSRNIIPGCIFFALKGENFNGNHFAAEALKKGALAVVVDEDVKLANDQIIRVDDVLKTLQEFATYHRLKTGITILAVTGSNGKTTTKELCKAVLSKKFKVYATEGNLNNHIGVPLTLLAMDEAIEVGIVEMGANHPGEIAALCEIAKPDYGLITNIGKAHLEGFGGISGVARAKGELFIHLMRNNKTLFLNRGNQYLPPLVPESYSRVVSYAGDSDLRVLQCESNPLLKLQMTCKGGVLNLETNLAGSYNSENVAAACAVGLTFGIPAEDIKQAIEGYQPKNNRSQLIRTGRNTVFMDAYNANPSSMSAAVQQFLLFSEPKKMLILGEMRELGTSSAQEHEDLIAFLKSRQVADVICVGEAFENFAKKAGYQYAENVDRLCEMLTVTPVNGSFIFVKGSRSNRLEKIISLL